MYVCICKGITDRQIREEVRQGARSLQEVSQRLGVATGCGKCAGCARQVISEAVEAEAAELDCLVETAVAV